MDAATSAVLVAAAFAASITATAPAFAAGPLGVVEGDTRASYAAPTAAWGSPDDGSSRESPGADTPPSARFPLRIGPVASLAFPRPISVAVLGTISDTVGVGVEYSALPTITVDGVSAHAFGLSGEGRYYIARSPVFVGAAFGYQSLSGDAVIQGVAGQGTATTVFVTPRAGLFWTTRAGFSIGADLGVQLPVSSTLSVTPALATDVVAQQDVFVAFTRRPLPEVHLLRVGWLF